MHDKKIGVLHVRGPAVRLQQRQQGMIVASEREARRLHRARCLCGRLGDALPQPRHVLLIDPRLQRPRAPQSHGVRPLVVVRGGHDQVRHFRRLGLHPFANFQDVVIEEANQVRSTHHQGLVTRAQGKATRVKIVVDAGRHAILP